MDVDVGRSLAQGLHNLRKVNSRCDSLRVRPNDVGSRQRPGYRARRAVYACWWIRRTRWWTARRPRRRAAKKYHDARSLSREPKVDMREEDWRAQVVVRNFVSQSAPIGTKRR